MQFKSQDLQNTEHPDLQNRFAECITSKVTVLKFLNVYKNFFISIKNLKLNQKLNF